MIFFNCVKILFKNFIIPCLVLSSVTWGQNKPGGTDLNVELWLRANDLTLVDSTAVTVWQDKSGNSRDAKQVNNFSVPILFTEGMNYNPKLNFSLNGTYPRLAGAANFVDPAKSYYVFFVSQQTTNANSYNTAFAFTSGQSRGSVGMRENRAWLVASGTVEPTNSNAKNYMVGAGYFTNQTASSTSQISLFTNGIPYNQNNLNTTLFTNAPFVIGTQNAVGNNNYFLGDLSEVIVLSADANAPVNVNQIKQINSYLALKYGITLDTASQPDYTDSDGTIIWNGANAIGFQKNIFGIGRDDVSAWHQKQAASYEDQSISVFINQLAYTNSENTGIIANKNYLLFGSNGVEGESEYIQTAGTLYNGVALPTRINKIYNKILKAQKSGTNIGPINLALKNEMYNVQYVLVSSSNQFTPNTTRFYPVVNGVATGVEVGDADFVGFASYRPTFTDSTFTTELWLDADELKSQNSADVKNWYDKSGFNRNFTQSITTNRIYPMPNFVSEGTNFNNKITFSTKSGYNTRLVGPNNFIIDSKEYYVYHVSKTTGVNRRANVISFDNTSFRNTFGWNYTRPWVHNSAGDREFTTVNKLFGIIGSYSSSHSNSLKIFRNGLAENFTGNLIFPANGKMQIGVSNGDNNDGFLGDISEIIIVSAARNANGTPNQTILEKINSYLALKYGIALDATAQPNYIDSDENIIWDGATNPNYTKDIFGIGRDDKYGLYQKQATNADFNSITLFLGDFKPTNKENTSIFTDDKSFLILGSNGLTGSASYNIQPTETFVGGQNIPYEIFLRYARTLKVSNVNNVGAVNIKLSNSFANAPYVLVSTDATFTPSTTRLYPVVNGVAASVTLNHNDYVSFVLIENRPGGSGLTLDLWLKADDLSLADGDKVDTWFDQSINSRDFVKRIDGNTTIATPTFKKYTGMNYNPTLFTGYSGTDIGVLFGPANINDPTREYYVYHVSYLKTADRQLGVVYAMNSGEFKNSYGWRLLQPWTNSDGDRSATLGVNKLYSINTTYTSNTNRIPGGTKIYVNGVVNNFPSEIFATSTNPMLIGAVNNGAGWPYYGDISEVIVLSRPRTSDTNPTPDQTDINKVNSYLALKYGISLNDTAFPNYLDSQGSIIWNGSRNNGYTNAIFGIGRDDLSGFNQKQSTSYDSPTVTAYLGDLQDLNTENTAVIANNRNFVVFGSNNGTGFVPYDHDENTSFLSGALTERVNVRHRYTLKAQKTGTIDYVNFLVTLPASYLLISKDPSFPVNQTNVYPITDMVANNIQIDDEDYISFSTYAKGPGGVVDALRLWLVADSLKIDFAGANNVNVWKDISPSKNDYSYDAVNLRGKTFPQWVACSPLMNFKPAIQFNSSAYLAIYGDLKNPAPMSKDAPDDMTSFVVYNAASYVYNPALFTHGFGNTVPNNGNTRFPSMGFSPENSVGRISNYGGGERFVNGTTAKGFALNKTTMHMLHTSAFIDNYSVTRPAAVNNDFNGWQDRVVPSGNFGQGFRMAKGGVIGGASSNNESYNGLISETFYYEKELTELEQNLVKSYVAAKYGITLRSNPVSSPTVNFNYIFSSGLSVWNGLQTPYSTYHHNVAGLMRDDQSSLDMKVSKSVEPGAVVTMMFSGDDPCDTQTTGFANDFSAIFWGNNNLPLANNVSYTNDPDVCGDIDNRMERIWMVNKTLPATQTSQKLILRAGGADFPYDGNGFEVFLLIADDPAKFTNKNWDQIIPGTFVNGEHQFSYTFTNEKTYFTFASKTVVGNCESCSFDGAKNLDFTRVTWPTVVNPNNTNVRNFDLDNDFNVSVQVSDPSSVLLNNFPIAGASNTLRIDRRGNNEVLTEIKFVDDANNPVSASTTFEIFNIDMGAGYTLDDVTIKGYCSTITVVPQITYGFANTERSTYNYVKSGSGVEAKAKARGVRYAGGVGYADKRARMLVYFDQPVERIEISYKVDGANNNKAKRIGIGPMQFTCIAKNPLPEPNNDGLIFTKQATEELLLCETVDYTFQIINTNCDVRTVSLQDALPSGMEWVVNSVILNSTTVTENDIVYNDNNLSITNISIPGGAEPYYIRAQAKFKDTATAGVYSNTAQMQYDKSGQAMSVASSDRFTGLASTDTEAKFSERPKSLKTSLVADLGCYDTSKIIEFTLNIENPNTSALSGSTINFSFNDLVFQLVAGSTQATNITLPTATVDELLMLENFIIPTGTSSISFKLQVANTTSAFDYDALTTLPFDQLIIYDVDIDGGSVCLDNLSISGEFVLPYCTYCTQVPITPLGFSTVESKVAINLVTVSSNEFENWLANTPNGYIAFSSSNRGFVITRATPAAITNPIEGMIIYNTDSNCISLYNGIEWKCIQRKCNN